MRLISGKTIDRYAEEHADARQALADWQAMVRAAHWRTGDEVVRTSRFPARTLPDRRLVFNLKGNDYRLVCTVQYADPDRGHNGIVRVHFFGTHAEYDKIDANTVQFTNSKP